MEHAKLITHIWNGDVTLEAPSKVSPLTGLMGSLMNVPVITLSCTTEMQRPIALMENDEVLPGASLGDVLAEELSIDVPFGALVLIQPQGFARQQDYTSAKLGEVLGGVILDMAQQSQIKVPQEEPEHSKQFNAVDVAGSIANLGHFAHPSAPRLQ